MVPKSTCGNVQLRIIVLFVVIGMIYSCSKAQNVESKTSVAAKSAPLSGQPIKNISNVQADSAGSLKRQTNQAKENCMLIIYYFHGNARCPTCYKLENFAKSEVETDFADAIKKGTLAWKTINVEEKGNEHYVDDYKLYTKSVIVSMGQNGKETSWKNLDQIWQLVHEEGKYRDYIKKEVGACLNGKCL